MLKKAILLLILSASFGVGLQAQQSNMNEDERIIPKNSIYLELFGNGFAYTLNYERHISSNYYLRAGGGYINFNLSGGGFSVFSIPVMMNKLYGKRNAKLELGIGFVLTNVDINFDDDADTQHEGMALKWFDFGITSTVGYRHQFNNGGVFRIGLHPRYVFGDYFSESLSNFGVTPGISFGGTF